MRSGDTRKEYMSRIGSQQIEVPTDVTVTTEGNVVKVKGPKGELSLTVPVEISVAKEQTTVSISRQDESKATRSLHGFVRAELSNYITGVRQGWNKSLELSGVGYRASLSGTNLVLNVGFSHPVTITPPPGIVFTLAEGKIIVTGIDKRLVGQIAADVRSVKKPEPYKGKGIKYTGEIVRKKAGKAAKAVGGAAAK